VTGASKGFGAANRIARSHAGGCGGGQRAAGARPGRRHRAARPRAPALRIAPARAHSARDGHVEAAGWPRGGAGRGAAYRARPAARANPGPALGRSHRVSRRARELAVGIMAAYSVIVLGATGNVGGRIVQLLIENPLCKKVVVVTRRKADAFADLKFSEVVVNMDRLEEEVAPHAQGVDVALAAFGVGKGSAKMPEEEVRKIEIAYPQAFCRAAKAGGARVCGVMTAAGADPEAGMKYAKIIGEKEKAVESVKFDFLGVYRPAVILGNSNTGASLATSCHCCTGPCRPSTTRSTRTTSRARWWRSRSRRSSRSRMATLPRRRP